MQKSVWTYNLQYVDHLEVQEKRLSPFLNCSVVKTSGNTLSKHPEAEGRFIIPSWQEVSSDYTEAVEKVFFVLWQTRAFENYLEGELYLERCHEESWILDIFLSIGKKARIIKAQMGRKYQGLSINDAKNSFAFGERGLGVFEAACIILGNPRRFSNENDLVLLCPGDICLVKGQEGDEVRVPMFYFRKGKLRFAAWH
ncbi:MAG: hypothetical protein AAB587_00025, partial [Patescibacteria group bacterium]